MVNLGGVCSERNWRLCSCHHRYHCHGLHSRNHLLPAVETQRFGRIVRRGQQMYVLASRSDGASHTGVYRVGALPSLLADSGAMFGHGKIPRHGALDQADARQFQWIASICTHSSAHTQQQPGRLQIIQYSWIYGSGLATQHAVALLDWSYLDDRVHICLSAVGVGRCCRILVLPVSSDAIAYT